MRKKIAVVGAGITGLSAALDLARVGHDVTVFEAAPQTGGLARGFQDERWQWPLEHFYHHLFQSDKEIIHLVDELGIKEKLFFPKPQSSIFFQNRIYPFDSIPSFFNFPGFNLFDTMRFGAVTAVLRYLRLWRVLERVTADRWMRRWYGKRVYESSWRPLLINKFGKYYDQVPMSWMWARIYARSFGLGYFEGGFQTFVDALTDKVVDMGGKIYLETPISRIDDENGRLRVSDRENRSDVFDQVLVTLSPQRLLDMVPSLKALHNDYAKQVDELTHIGALVLVAAMRWPLMKKTYWLNIPADTPDRGENEIPFLALVEHTNYIDNRHYGGDHLIYMGDYLPGDHAYFSMEKAEIEELFFTHLQRFNPNFRRDWVRKTWLFRADYAQPVPFVNHSKNLPDLQTPVNGLYFASMSQVYPWDRGTNFAVEIGRRAVRLMEKDGVERQTERKPE
ncbi:MAG: NAD(P)/FAD-dependent oxidoreductase [Ardenticatenaceae bacterium]|nr:NAD(P)/FAD-dependent oxidoreductase [Ardenticatenaceae bacterium]